MKIFEKDPVYLITEDGKIYSKLTNKFIKQRENVNGYMIVGLRDNKFYRVHRLVAEVFLPNPYNKREVNHIDGNKRNNHVSNLEWVTSKENKAHAWENGLYTHKCENHHSATLTDVQVHALCKDLEDGMRNIDAVSKYNVHKDLIAHIKRGDIWKDISSQYNIHVKRSKTKSVNTVTKVCSLLEKGISIKDISEQVDMRPSEVSRIKRGEIFKEISINFDIKTSPRITEEGVKEVCELLQEGRSIKYITDNTSYSASVVSKIKRRVSWKNISKNYIW